MRFGPLYMNLLFESEHIRPVKDLNDTVAVHVMCIETGDMQTFEISINNSEISISSFLSLVQMKAKLRFRSKFTQSPEYIGNVVMFYLAEKESGQQFMVSVKTE